MLAPFVQLRESPDRKLNRKRKHGLRTPKARCARTPLHTVSADTSGSTGAGCCTLKVRASCARS